MKFKRAGGVREFITLDSIYALINIRNCDFPIDHLPPEPLNL
jgi:hypothetical protein